MLSWEELCELYRHGDFLLVSALRDGMNLVAKEYVASQVDGDGVLVLSDRAGASEELGEDAISIDPEETMTAIVDALTMPSPERQARMDRLRRRVSDQGLFVWMEAVFATAAQRRQPHAVSSRSRY